MAKDEIPILWSEDQNRLMQPTPTHGADSLKERLRKSRCCILPNEQEDHELPGDALARIEELEAENKRLNIEWTLDVNKHERTIATLEAENKRLRDAWPLDLDADVAARTIDTLQDKLDRAISALKLVQGVDLSVDDVAQKALSDIKVKG